MSMYELSFHFLCRLKCHGFIFRGRKMFSCIYLSRESSVMRLRIMAAHSIPFLQGVLDCAEGKLIESEGGGRTLRRGV